MFNVKAGNVYRFLGEITDGQDPTSVITEKFITAIGTDLVSIVVVSAKGEFVVYSDCVNALTTEDFEFVTNLIPDLVIELEPAIVVIPEENV